MRRLACPSTPWTAHGYARLIVVAAVFSALSQAQTAVDASQRRPNAGDFAQVQLPAVDPSLLQNTVAATRPAASVPNLQLQYSSTVDFVYPHDYYMPRWVDVKNNGAYTELDQSFTVTGPNGFSLSTDQQTIATFPQPGPLYLQPNETQRIWVILNWSDLDQSAWTAGSVYDYVIVLTISPKSNGQTPAQIQAQSQTVTLHNQVYVYATAPIVGNGSPVGDNNASIQGTVYDAATGKPIANAGVKLIAYSESPFLPYTDSAGHYSVALTAFTLAQNGVWKPYGVKITAAGYADFHTAVAPHAGDTIRLDAPMTPAEQGPAYTLTSKTDGVLNQYAGQASKDGDYFAFTSFHSIVPPGTDSQTYLAQAKLSFFGGDGALLWQFPLYAETPAVSVADDGSLVATARDDTTRSDNGVYLLNNAGQVVWSVGNLGSTDPSGFREVRISHGMKYLAAGDSSGNLYLLDVAAQKLVWQRFVNGAVRTLAFDSGDATLYVGSGDGYFYCFHIDGTLAWRTYVGSWSTAFNMSTNYILVGGKEGYFLSLLDRPTGRTLWQFPLTQSPSDVMIAPDESYIAATGSSNQFGTLLFDLSGVVIEQDTNAGMVAIASGASYMLLTNQDTGSNDIGATYFQVMDRDGCQLWNSGHLDTTIDRGPLDGFAWISDDGRKMVAANGNWVYFLAQQGPGATAAGVTSAASYGASATNGVSPGEILTLFGQGLGPAQLTTLQLDSTGKVATLLAGSQVLFDNTPAPIIYTSSGQLSVIAPYDLVGKSTVTITAEYQGLAAPPIDVAVVSANPALFTLDSSGQGDAAIVRPDGSVVNAADPASPGDILVLFAEGYGASTPALPDGAVVTTTWPVPMLNTVLLIDGQPVATQYCGAAPYIVNGVLQVNFQVPVLVPGAHQIQLQVGNRTSPTGVTLRTR
jgi:uncharacterized protein (TIGR03437 family)